MAAAVVASTFACSDSSPTGAGRGTLALLLTDAPFIVDSVQRADVFVVRVDGRLVDADSATAAKGASDDSASAGGWTVLAAPNATVNLLAYQNGQTLPLGAATLPAGDYAGFRLIVDPTKSSITLKNGTVLNGGSTPGVLFPSGTRTGIKVVLTTAITVSAGGSTTMVIDFDVANSFVLRGTTVIQSGLLFRPVVRGSVKP